MKITYERISDISVNAIRDEFDICASFEIGKEEYPDIIVAINPDDEEAIDALPVMIRAAREMLRS